MKLVFYSLVLNHHQACVADEFYDILGDDYAFVETAECNDQKGATEDYSKRPYLVKAWESAEAWQHAMELAETAEVCVFGGYEALPFEKARMKRGLLSFDMGERMLKRGWLNLASPRILKMIMAYHLGGWRRRPIYKLCCSSFAKGDQYKLRSYKDKCYKWGYFTSVGSYDDETLRYDDDDHSSSETINSVRLMWCARFLTWKHPEMAVELASLLKKDGYRFHIDIYGGEGLNAAHEKVYSRKSLEQLVDRLDVKDCVTFQGQKPNAEILQAMREHDIFLFTSDKTEGWGAVANEAMANGCCLVGSDAIGAVPYLVKDGVNGMMFESCNVLNLYSKVRFLMDNPEKRRELAMQGQKDMRDLWSPRNAAESLLQLIDDIKNDRDTSIKEGPCSKA